MLLFLFMLGICILLLTYMYIEAGNVELVKIDISKQPSSIKIMHISDIHISLLRIKPQRLQNAITKLKPDIIIITGDFIERMSELPKIKSWFSKLNLHLPVYACLGNHEHTAFLGKAFNQNLFLSFLKELNITPIINECITITLKNKKYNLIGIDDYRNKKHNLYTAFLKVDESAEKNIVFSHNPDLVFELPSDKTSIFLCGHFHGGQIRMPFHIEYTVLRKEKLCHMGIYSGLHNVRGIPIYINRGLGNVLVPFRFLARPEIALIKI